MTIIERHIKSFALAVLDPHDNRKIDDKIQFEAHKLTQIFIRRTAHAIGDGDDSYAAVLVALVNHFYTDNLDQEVFNNIFPRLGLPSMTLVYNDNPHFYTGGLMYELPQSDGKRVTVGVWTDEHDLKDTVGGSVRADYEFINDKWQLIAD